MPVFTYIAVRTAPAAAVTGEQTAANKTEL